MELPALLQRYHLDSSSAVAGARQGVGALGTLRGAFGQLKGAIGLAGVAMGSLKVGEFLKEAVHGAAEGQQVARTTTALFGQYAKEITEWGEKSAFAFGITDTAAQQFANQMGTVLKGFGFMPKAAAEMSLSLEKVAGDVAIFKQQDPANVVNAFRAALYGSSRGLKQYGIDTSQAALQQAALSIGIKTSSKEWDSQTKAQVNYALIMRGTSAIVGTAKNRQGDLAVASKALSAQFDNLRDRIGTALLPIMSAFIGFITRHAVPALTSFVGWIVNVGQAIGDKLARPVRIAFDFIRTTIDRFVLGLRNPTADLDPFGWLGNSVARAGQVVRRSIDFITGAFHGLVRGFTTGGAEGFSDGWVGAFERIGAVVRSVVNNITSLWHRLEPVFGPVFRTIGDFLDTSAGKTAATAAGFTILGVSISAVLGAPLLGAVGSLATITNTLQGLIAVLPFAALGWTLAIGVIVGAIVYFYKHSQTMRDAIHGIVDIIQKEWLPRLRAAGAVLRDYLARGVEIAADALRAALPYIRDFGLALIRGFERVVPPVLRFVTAVVREVVPALRALGGFVSRNIVPILGGLGAVLGALITSAVIDGIIALSASFATLGAAAAAAEAPMLLVVGAIALLGFGLAYAYTHFDGFRALVDAVADRVYSFGRVVVRNLLPAFFAVAGFVKDNIIPVLAGLGGVLAAIVTPLIISAIGTKLVAAFKALSLVVAAVTSPAVLTVAAIGLLAAGAAYAYIHFETFRNMVDSVGRGLNAFARFVARDVIPAVGKLADIIVHNLIPALVGLGVLWAAAVGPEIVASVSLLTTSVGVLGLEFGAMAAAAAGPLAIAAAIALLAAGVTYAYIHFKGFRDVVNGAARDISSVAIPAIREVAKTFTDVTSQLTDFVHEHWAEIGTIVRGALVAVGVALRILEAQIQSLLFVWRTVGDQVLAVVRAIFGSIGGIVRGAMEVVLGIIGVFLDLITLHWGKAWDDLGHIVRGAFAAMRALVGGQLRVVSNIIVAGARSAVALFGLAWEGLKDGAEAALRGLLGVVRRLPVLILGSLLALPTALLKLGSAIVASILAGIAGAAPALARWFAQLPGIILAALSGAGGWLLGVGKAIINGIVIGLAIAVGAVAVWFAGLPLLIIRSLPNAATWLVDTGHSIINGLWQGMQDAWDTALRWAGNISAALIAAFENAPRWLVETGAAIIQGLWDGAMSVWDAYLDWNARLGVAIVRAFRAAPRWLVATGKAVVHGLWVGARSAFSDLLDWLGRAGELIVGIFKGSASWLLDAGRSIIVGLLTGMLSVWGSTVAWVARIGPAFVALLANSPTLLLGAGKAIVQGLWTGMKTVWSLVLTWAGHLAQGLIGSIGNARTWLSQIGRDVIEGFWDGLKNIWSKVTGWFSGIVGHIPGVFKRALGIGSPSRVMRDIGRDTMGGLGDGLDRGWDGVARKLNSFDVAREFKNTKLTVTPEVSLGPTRVVGRRGAREPSAAPIQSGYATQAQVQQQYDLGTAYRTVLRDAISLQQQTAQNKVDQEAYNLAVRQYTANSPQARAALATWKLGMLDTSQSTADAVREAKDFAVSISRSSGLASGDAKGKLSVYRNTLVDLARTTSGPVHAALWQLVKNLDAVSGLHPKPTVDVDTKDADRKIKRTKDAIDGLPPGHTTRVSAITDTATIRLHNFRGELALVPKKGKTVWDLSISSALTSLSTLKQRLKELESPIPVSAAIRADAGRLPGNVRHNATGGPLRPHEWSWVGEKGPELIHNDAAPRTVVPHIPSLAIAQTLAPHITVPPIKLPPLKRPGESELDTVTVRALVSTLARATATPARPSAPEEPPQVNVTYDVDVYPEEHTLTERGLVSRLRQIERHGTLRPNVGLPRERTRR